MQAALKTLLTAFRASLILLPRGDSDRSNRSILGAAWMGVCWEVDIMDCCGVDELTVAC